MEGYQFTVEQLVTWRDLDALAHVNNAVYVTYFEHGRLQYISHLLGADGIRSQILAEQTIAYKSPAVLWERLTIGTRVSEMRKSSYVMEQELREIETNRLIATCRAVMVSYDYEKAGSCPIPSEFRAQVSRFEGREF